MLLRGILHDPIAYPDPMEFKPERYFSDGRLDFSNNDPGRVAFGFGRRCVLRDGSTLLKDWCLITFIGVTQNLCWDVLRRELSLDLHCSNDSDHGHIAED